MNRQASHFLFLFFSSLILILGSCTDTSEQVDIDTIEQVPFEPSPQEVAEVVVKVLEIGTTAPDFNLPGVDGKYYSLEDFDQSEVLVVIFTCNHCPTAQAYEDRIVAFHQEYQLKNVAVVAISPNSPLGLLYEELGYTDLGDSYEDMRNRAEKMNFRFPYLYDGDTQSTSIQYGPVATPHVFVFDRERKLQYQGRIDSSEKPGTANSEDLRSAVDSILAGESVVQTMTKTFGCSTKWAWKNDWKKKVDREWKELPVDLETINKRGLKTLLKNDSDKLRLINLWATWCGPCVIEYPEFIVIHRMFKGRDFEFVSISADSPDRREDAQKFLQRQNSAVKNYIWHNDDHSGLIEAFAPDWEGALPFTILVEPGGKRVYTHQNIINPLELKRTIVDHPMIGRYY